jgi:BolA protein
MTERSEALSVQQTIEQKLRHGLAPSHLDVVNESHMHSVPPGSESHFRLVIVAERFSGLPLVRRHQLVNALLQEELDGPLHALSMQTLTPEQWQARAGATLASPACRGGGKADADNRG